MEALRDHDHSRAPQIVEYRGRAHRGVGKHEVGPGPMQRRNIAVPGGPADDLYVWTKTTTIDRQIDVQVVVVRRNDHSRRMGNARALKCLVISGASFHVGGPIPDPGGIALDDPIVDFAFLKCSSDRATDPPATDDDYRTRADMIDTEQLVGYFRSCSAEPDKTSTELASITVPEPATS